MQDPGHSGLGSLVVVGTLIAVVIIGFGVVVVVLVLSQQT